MRDNSAWGWPRCVVWLPCALLSLPQAQDWIFCRRKPVHLTLLSLIGLMLLLSLQHQPVYLRLALPRR